MVMKIIDDHWSLTNFTNYLWWWSHNDQAGWRRRRGHLHLQQSRFMSFQQFRFYRPLCFILFHLLAFVVTDYTCLHIVITWSLFFPNCCSWSFFFELLLYHITALTVLFSFFCFSLCKLFYQMTFFCKWSFKLTAQTLLFAFLFVVLQFILPYHFFLQNILSD